MYIQMNINELWALNYNLCVSIQGADSEHFERG